MSDTKRILITGAAGKVGQTVIRRMLADPRFDHWTIRGLCHNRPIASSTRVEVVTGSISDPVVVDQAMAGVTHVLHLATVKESPELVMDVTIKGLFWLLEASRRSPTLERFVLIGGDAGVGHFVVPHELPVTEEHPHTAYPGSYALSKVLEEVMLEQYYVQYDLPGCCLRAPWIHEKDDFRFALSRDEFVDLFLEDLELPDLAKRRVVDTESVSWHRAGYSVLDRTGRVARLELGPDPHSGLWAEPLELDQRRVPDRLDDV